LGYRWADCWLLGSLIADADSIIRASPYRAGEKTTAEAVHLSLSAPLKATPHHQQPSFILPANPILVSAF
jgi:hypothetical protein